MRSLLAEKAAESFDNHRAVTIEAVAMTAIKRQ